MSLWVRDQFACTINDEHGNCVIDYEGYVPSFLPNRYGDALDLIIDMETGTILNWPSILKLQQGIEQAIEDERIVIQKENL